MQKSRPLFFMLIASLLTAGQVSVFVHAQAVRAKAPQIQEVLLPDKSSLRGSAVFGNALWVSGNQGTVYKSTDGGKNWVNVSPVGFEDADFRDIALFDHQTAIVMSVGSGKDSKLLKTTDGGQSWQLLYQNSAPNGFFDSIDFWDDQKGLLLGDPVDGYYVVLKTDNGGKSWRRIAPNRLPQKLEQEAAFAASGNTLIVQPGGMAWFTTGGHAASVYYSRDYGENWRRISAPLYQQSATAGGYALGTNASQQVFVMGGDYKQRDGHYQNLVRLSVTGEKAEALALEGQTRGLRTAMACTSDFCLVSGKLGTDWSRDQGVTWRPLGPEGVYTLAAGKQLILGAGAAGRIWIARMKH